MTTGLQYEGNIKKKLMYSFALISHLKKYYAIVNIKINFNKSNT